MNQITRVGSTQKIPQKTQEWETYDPLGRMSRFNDTRTENVSRKKNKSFFKKFIGLWTKKLKADPESAKTGRFKWLEWFKNPFSKTEPKNEQKLSDISNPSEHIFKDESVNGTKAEIFPLIDKDVKPSSDGSYEYNGCSIRLGVSR